VKVLPAAMIVPVRDDVVLFAAAVNEMLPLPVRFVPFDTVIHELPLEAVQAHEDVVVTVTVPVPPVPATLWLVGEMEYVQLVPDWLSVKVSPAIVIVPVRSDADVLAVAL
jgi:hypothetical protein